VCAKTPDETDGRLVLACSECFKAVEKDGGWEGILGTPEVLISTRRDLRFEHETAELPELSGLTVIDLQPIEASAGLWLACTSTGSLIEINPVQRSVRTMAQVPPDGLDFDNGVVSETSESWTHGPRITLRVSRKGEMAAVANTYGRRGVVLDLITGQVTMRLLRDEYHEDVSAFPLAFCELDDRLVVIHGTQWNRLDVSDARTGVLLTQRQPTSYLQGEGRPAHYLDYFHCQLSVSPGQQFIADNGWVWHPVGVVTTWSLPRWLHENVWESEDGPSKKSPCWRGYYWDGPLCWIDDQRLAVWGYGQDDQWQISAVCVYDAVTGEQVQWFAGPRGSLAFDKYLFAFDQKEGTSVWDVASGERLVKEEGFCPAGLHRGAKHFLSLLDGGSVRVSRLINE
jgi:hypothetical protein